MFCLKYIFDITEIKQDLKPGTFGRNSDPNILTKLLIYSDPNLKIKMRYAQGCVTVTVSNNYVCGEHPQQLLGLLDDQ